MGSTGNAPCMANRVVLGVCMTSMEKQGLEGHQTVVVLRVSLLRKEGLPMARFGCGYVNSSLHYGLGIGLKKNIGQILINASLGLYVMVMEIDDSTLESVSGPPGVDVWVVCLHWPRGVSVLGLPEYSWA
ncbi:hypothetical protein L1987_22264 [Smallanthus sonchifolius]|uniref:Uncharacterized protein n=1 Tax=Smallanthus sonchifolius TaxID=185202 RepID=A0ACB9IDN2_9ASTR|nr:hypothetical protein L1987_22264 [Smallanthus sonchifolius]